MSNGVYQIEHSIRANKISLKDYVLNSDICTILKDNNISNYSINELNKIIDLRDLNKLSIDELNDLYDKVMVDINNYSINNAIKIVDEVFNYYIHGNKIINYNSNIDIK